MHRHTTSVPRLLAVALLACSLLAPTLAPCVAWAEEGASGLSASEEPSLASAAAILVEPTTGTVLLEKNADDRREPASTTKVMTALVVLENADLDDEVTVEESDFDEVTADSSVAGLRAGETLTIRDLLACLLLPSGNDASYVLARAVGGDWRSFVEMMNERAAELGCEGTHFANPCGLHDDDHYTTARDLVTIFTAAMEHPEFAEIAGSATWDLPATSENDARTLESTDRLIDPESPVYLDGAVLAGKTGYTGEAGRCLVSEAQRDGMTLVGVTLGAPDGVDSQGLTANFTDMYSLLQWGFGAWRTGEVVVAGDVLGSAPVTLSDDGEEVDVAASAAVVATVPRETTLADLTVTPTWQGNEGDGGSFQAPLEAGQTLGRAEVALGGRVLGSVDLVASTGMGLSVPAFVMWWLSDPIHAVLVVALAVTAFLAIWLLSRPFSRRTRRRGRYQMAVGQHGRIAPGAGGRRLAPPASRTARPARRSGASRPSRHVDRGGGHYRR